jgi:hypothetical protein
LFDHSILHHNNADQQNGQERPDNDKDPDVDLFICDAKYIGPVDQDVHAPIEDLVHYALAPF